MRCDCGGCHMFKGVPPRPVGAQNFGEAPKAFWGDQKVLGSLSKGFWNGCQKLRGDSPKSLGPLKTLRRLPNAIGVAAACLGESPKAIRPKVLERLPRLFVVIKRLWGVFLRLLECSERLGGNNL